MKVLLLAYNFPPFIRASSLRTFSWYKEFSDKIDITVVTREWSENRVYKKENYFEEDAGNGKLVENGSNKRIFYVPNKFNFYFKIKNKSFIKKRSLHRFFTFVEMIFTNTRFIKIESQRSLYLKARSLLEKNNYDLVITSGEPFVLFKYCYLLNKKFNIPYILDYRDGWTTNFTLKKNPNLIIKSLVYLSKKREKKYLLQAVALSAISKQLSKEILDNIGIEKRQIIINNGVDLSVMKNLKPFSEYDDTFLITFIGTIYETHRFSLLLESFSKLVELFPKEKIVLLFVGSTLMCPEKHYALLMEYQRKYPDNIKTIDYVKHEESLKWQKTSKLLLKFNEFAQKENHFGKKLYEYAAVGKKVITINGKNIKSKKGHFFPEKPFQYLCNNKKEVFQYMKNFFLQWKKRESLSNEIEFTDLEKYSTKTSTEKLENFILNHFEKK